MGKKIAVVLDRLLEMEPTLLQEAEKSIDGSGTGFPNAAIRLARKALLRVLDPSIPVNDLDMERPGIFAPLIAAYCNATGDPDGVLASWAIHGAPMGILHDIDHTGIFPRVLDPEIDESSLRMLYTDPTVQFLNYKSAEEPDAEVQKIHDKMEEAGWARKFNSPSELQQYLGEDDIVLNRMALISKVKPD